MATTRIKDISSTVTSLASDDYIAVDGATNGTRKMVRSSIYTDVAAAFTGAPTTYDICPLNSGTNKIDATYLPTSGDTPKGAYDANAGSPSLADGVGTAGDYYDVTVSGTQNLGSGNITFTVGDVVKYNGSTWYKIDSVANFLDGYPTAATSRTALEVNSVDEDAASSQAKLIGPSLYYDGSNDVTTVADSDLLTFSTSTEFGTTTSGTWSPDDNTPTLTDGTGTLNQHYMIDRFAGTVAQGGSTLSVINGASTVAGQAVYYDGSVWRIKDIDDLPFSITASINIKDATSCGILGKYGSSNTTKEWSIETNASDFLVFTLWGTGNFTSTLTTDDALTSYEGDWIHVAIVYQGAGPGSTNAFSSCLDNAVIYINGKPVSATASNNANYFGMGNTSQAFRIGVVDASFGNVSIKRAAIYNRALSAAEVVKDKDAGGSFADEWGAGFGGVYSSDFSAGVDSWNTVGTLTLTGNIDSVGPGGDLRDDTLRMVPDATNGSHAAYKSGLTNNKRFRVSFDYYIPSTNSNVDSFNVALGSGNFLGAHTATLDAWTHYIVEGVCAAASNLMLVYLADGGATTFADAGSDDTMYIRNVKFTEIGVIADFRAENFVAGKLLDLSSNNFVGTNSGAILTGGRTGLQLDTDGASSGNTVLSIYDGTNHLAYVTDKGDLNANSISSGASSELTIATGAVTCTKSYHTIDTEGDAASDDLDTISGGRAGQILVVQANNSARTVVLKDGTGNLKLSGDITLDNTEDTAVLVSDGTNWYELSNSNNGA